jgi:hypothetical protein
LFIAALGAETRCALRFQSSNDTRQRHARMHRYRLMDVDAKPGEAVLVPTLAKWRKVFPVTSDHLKTAIKLTKL